MPIVTRGSRALGVGALEMVDSLQIHRIYRRLMEDLHEAGRLIEQDLEGRLARTGAYPPGDGTWGCVPGPGHYQHRRVLGGGEPPEYRSVYDTDNYGGCESETAQQLSRRLMTAGLDRLIRLLQDEEAEAIRRNARD
jgi:hypothetical protein